MEARPWESDIRNEVFFAISELKAPILEMSNKSMSLEDIFLKLTQSSEDEEAASEEASEENNEDAEEDGEYTPLFTSDTDEEETKKEDEE